MLFKRCNNCQKVWQAEKIDSSGECPNCQDDGFFQSDSAPNHSYQATYEDAPEHHEDDE